MNVTAGKGTSIPAKYIYCGCDLFAALSVSQHK